MATKTLLASPEEPEHPTAPEHPTKPEHPAWCINSRCGGEHYSDEIVVPGKQHYYVEILQNDGDPEAQVSILDGQWGGPYLRVPASIVGGLATALHRLDRTITDAQASSSTVGAGPAAGHLGG